MRNIRQENVIIIKNINQLNISQLLIVNQLNTNHQILINQLIIEQPVYVPTKIKNERKNSQDEYDPVKQLQIN